MQQLCSYGATRTFLFNVGGFDLTLAAEDAAADHDDITAWLTASRHWSTPLHHLSVISPDRTRSLLRDGADLFAASHTGGSTPLALAQGMLAAGKATGGSASHLVLCAARPWSPKTHVLFPAAARERACLIMRVLYLVAWKYLRPGLAGMDFIGLILQFDVLRE